MQCYREPFLSKIIFNAFTYGTEKKIYINKQTKYKIQTNSSNILNYANNKKEQRNGEDRLQAGSDPGDFWLSRNNMAVNIAN